MRSRARTLWILTRLSFRADRAAAIAASSLFVLQGLLGTAETFFAAGLVDAAVRLDGHDALVAVIGIVAIQTTLNAVSMIALDARFRLVEKTTLLLEQELIDAMVGAPGLDLHERPTNLDRIEVLRKHVAGLAQTVAAALHNLSIAASFFSAVGVLVAIHPLLALLPLAGVPALVSSGRATTAYQRTLDATAERQRRSDHLFLLTTTPGPAKELRTFGLGRRLLARHGDLLASAHRDLDRVSLRWSIGTALSWGLLGVAKVAATAFVALQAINGHLSLASVILVWSMGASLDVYLRQINEMVSWLLSQLRSAERYVGVLDDARDLTLAEVPWEPSPAPTALQRGIELDGVSFRYPDSERDVLHDVTLSIPAGSIVALVGENGAGKSTLIKLLGRYYRPTNGVVRVDGVDLARIDVEAWRARISGAFQDHARFELVAREVVGVGDLARADDEPAILDALGRAGGSELPSRLDAGLATPLGTSFEDGVEPSGGQWQQLALGRALLRERPLLLLLDEPTSALDPEAEHDLFDGYASAARGAAAETGAITLLVSHRFSTVRMADIIVVLQDGAVAEAGSHAELMASRGLYAELYAMQARAYR